MIFKGDRNESVEFKILKYQFEEYDNEWDANWLVFYVKFNDHPAVKDPGITSHELKKLTNWFVKLSNNICEKEKMCFMDTNHLAFELRNNQSALDKIIRISGNQELFVDIKINNIGLKKIINYFEQEVIKFPMRS